MNTNIGPWFLPSVVQHFNNLKNLTKLAKEFIPIKNLEGENSRERLKDIKEIRVRNISYWDP